MVRFNNSGDASPRQKRRRLAVLFLITFTVVSALIFFNIAVGGEAGNTAGGTHQGVERGSESSAIRKLCAKNSGSAHCGRQAALLGGGTSVSMIEALSSAVGRWFYVEHLHPGLFSHAFIQFLPTTFSEATKIVKDFMSAENGALSSSSTSYSSDHQPSECYYEPGWEQVFDVVKSSVPIEVGSTRKEIDRLSIASTCNNIVLQCAPWCNFNISEVADALLDVPTPPSENTGGGVDGAQQKPKDGNEDQSPAPMELDTIEKSDEAFVKEQRALAANARKLMRRKSKAILEGASRLGHINDKDKELLSHVKWKEWPAHKPQAGGGSGGSSSGTQQQNDVDELLGKGQGRKNEESTPSSASASTVPSILNPSDVAKDGTGGNLYLHRTGHKYPILTALRRDEDDERGLRPGTQGQPFDKDEDLVGFHACMFGVKRNLTSTIERIVQNVLEHMQPQRLHVVTNDHGYQEMLDVPGAVDVDSGDDESTIQGKARAAHFNDFLSLVSPFASSFVATKFDAATATHNCSICKGFFPREVCRMSILTDLSKGVPVDLVLLFRPDMYLFNPIFLHPYTHTTRVPNLDDVNENTPAAEVNGVSAGGETAPPMSAAHPDYDKPITKWRVHTKPRYSLIIDKGFLPGAFGVINDVNLTKSTILVHSRVTFPMDLHWIGDPVVLGHFHVMNHWMDMFSVMSSSERYGWDEAKSGEMHHHDFYMNYIRPLFATAPSGVDRVEIKVFDFQFSLYRSDPVINKQIMSLKPNYAAYQQQTIFMKFATKWDTAECMRYQFVPSQFNVSSFYTKTLLFQGEIGRLRLRRVPMKDCQQVVTPPGLQTCFQQYQRIIYYKKGKNIHNPCKPYCGVIPIMFREGLCLHVGNKGPKKKYPATFSVSPMIRNASGEVLRFNVVNPAYVINDNRHIKQDRLRELAKKEKEAEQKEREARTKEKEATEKGDSVGVKAARRAMLDAKKAARGAAAEHGKNAEGGVDFDKQSATHLDEEDKFIADELKSEVTPQPPPPSKNAGGTGGGGGNNNVAVSPVFKKGSKKYRYVSRSRKN